MLLRFGQPRVSALLACPDACYCLPTTTTATTRGRERGKVGRVELGITSDEAARILAVHVATVDRMIRRGALLPTRKYATAQLSRSQVEHLALTTRSVRQLVAGDYWVSRAGAAEMLGRSDKRVQQLSKADRLPFEVHPATGWKLYRRHQLAVIAHARKARFGNG